MLVFVPYGQISELTFPHEAIIVAGMIEIPQEENQGCSSGESAGRGVKIDWRRLLSF